MNSRSSLCFIFNLFDKKTDKKQSDQNNRRLHSGPTVFPSGSVLQ